MIGDFLKKVQSVADHITAICLVLLSMAGALKVVFGLGYGIYYVSVGALLGVAVFRCGLALRSCNWHIVPFSNILLALGLQRKLLIYLFLYCALFGWLVLTSLWTTAPKELWKEDFFYICVLLSVIGLTGLCVTWESENRFLLYWVAGAAVTSFYVLQGTFAATSAKEYMQFFKEDQGSVRLTLATPQGVGLAISFFHLCVAESKKRKILWLVITLLFITGIGRSVARGTLLLSIVTIGIVFFFYAWHYQGPMQEKIKKLWKYAVGFAMLIFGLFFVALNVEKFASRLARMTNISHEWSKYRGGRLWAPAWGHIQEAFFFGHGLGFNSAYPDIRQLHYPHNLFLQVWLDGGLVAFFLLSALLIWPIAFFLKHFKSNHNDPVLLSLFAILILLILEFSKSYDFYAAISLVVVSVLSVKHLEGPEV